MGGEPFYFLLEFYLLEWVDLFDGKNGFLKCHFPMKSEANINGATEGIVSINGKKILFIMSFNGEYSSPLFLSSDAGVINNGFQFYFRHELMALFIGNQPNLIGESLYCINCDHQHLILLCLYQKLKIFVKIRRIYTVTQIILTNNRHSCDLFQNRIVLDPIKVHLNK